MDKLCSACMKEKPLSEFGKNKARSDGVTAQCKECYNAYMRAYLAGNPDHLRRVKISKSRRKTPYATIDCTDPKQAAEYLDSYKIDGISRNFLKAFRTLGSCGCGSKESLKFIFEGKALAIASLMKQPLSSMQSTKLICKDCLIPISTSKTTRVDKATRRRYIRNLYRKKADALIELFGGECIICGVKEDLEFDHINPETKSFSVCSGIMSFPWDTVVEEAQKCQLLCHEHHLQKTLKQRFDIDYDPSVV